MSGPLHWLLAAALCGGLANQCAAATVALDTGVAVTAMPDLMPRAQQPWPARLNGRAHRRTPTRHPPLFGASGQFRRNSLPRFQGICLRARPIAQRPKNVTMKVPTSNTR